jgi:hypothetical protein
MTRNHSGSHVPKKHEWVSFFSIELCFRCGKVRRDDTDDKACPGKGLKVVVR